MELGILLLIVAGALLGWLASIVADVETRPGILLNLGVGIGGALVAGLIVNPLVGSGNIVEGQFGLLALFVALIGAVLLLAVVNLLLRDAHQ